MEGGVPEDAVGVVADALRHPAAEAGVEGGHHVVGEVGRLLQRVQADVVLDEEHAERLRHVLVEHRPAVLGAGDGCVTAHYHLRTPIQRRSVQSAGSTQDAGQRQSHSDIGIEQSSEGTSRTTYYQQK